eukprot:COSAG01_NODE_33940_length_556_cov_0.735230_1_plen_121_part_10
MVAYLPQPHQMRWARIRGLLTRAFDSHIHFLVASQYRESEGKSFTLFSNDLRWWFAGATMLLSTCANIIEPCVSQAKQLMWTSMNASGHRATTGARAMRRLRVPGHVNVPFNGAAQRAKTC